MKISFLLYIFQHSGDISKNRHAKDPYFNIGFSECYFFFFQNRVSSHKISISFFPNPQLPIIYNGI